MGIKVISRWTLLVRGIIIHFPVAARPDTMRVNPTVCFYQITTLHCLLPPRSTLQLHCTFVKLTVVSLKALESLAREGKMVKPTLLPRPSTSFLDSLINTPSSTFLASASAHELRDKDKWDVS